MMGFLILNMFNLYIYAIGEILREKVNIHP